MMRWFGRLLALGLIAAVGVALAIPAEPVTDAELSPTNLLAAISAIGALGTAAFSLVDASKALPGTGLSQVGWSILKAELAPFGPVLQRALGMDWVPAINAHWVNGRPRDEQKAMVKSLLRLGLDEHTAPVVAAQVSVDAGALAVVVEKLRHGVPIDDAELNLLGRIDATIDARLDAAFDLADQRYRNLSRAAAGLAALVLALLAAAATGQLADHWQLALLAGLLAVPVAPIAKDLASSLQAAAATLRVGGK